MPKFGSISLSPNVEATVASFAADATVNINVTNGGDSGARIRIAIGSGLSAQSQDWIEGGQHGFSLPAGQSLERTGFAVSAGERVFVSTDQPNVSVRVSGYSEE